MIRRVIDIVVSAIALALSSPLLLAAVIAIKLDSRGPAFYRQRRSGLHGEQFDMLKLRTMVDGAEHVGAGLAVNAGDTRITRVGAFLRRVSLDELPNLVNVLRGEMSLIGPRPTLPAQVAQYTARQHGRLAVKPGITGWAQINYPYGASIEDSRHKLEYDLYYAKNYTPFLDLLILLQTLRVVLWNEGAR